MEKNNDIQQNKLTDDELEQVGGGRMFGIFTTEFKEFLGRMEDQEDFREEAEDQYGVKTLEMRVKPKKKRKSNNIVKL